MSSPKRLTERVANPFAGSRVDRGAGTIGNVVLCGFESANGRDYPAAVFKRDFAKYEGRPVNADHAQSATVDRRLGWFSGVRVGEDGKPRGTLNLLKTHPLYERVMEAAERNPSLFGFSHVAYCKTRTERGREVVESIDRVESIDLVADPATTQGFFESKTMGLTVRKLCEALVKHAKITSAQVRPLKRLGEMDGMDAAPTALDVPPDDTADPADGVSAAFKAAIGAVVDSAMSGDMDPKDALAKIKKLLQSHGEVNADGTPDTGAGEEDDDMPKESRRPSLAGVLKECTDKGFTPDTTQLVAIADIPTAAGRASLIEQLKKASEGQGRETPRSSPRAGTQTTRTAPATEAKLPDDPKAFAARYRE